MDQHFLDDDFDRPREACGVFGIYATGSDVARLAFFALYALQHRGQESAGIATCDGHMAFIHKGMGLVHQVFNEDKLRPLQGHLAIGQNRYSTTGGSHLRNAQPYLIETMHGPLGVGHNGNLTNALHLRQKLLERGVGLSSSSDSEVITQMLAAPLPGAPLGQPDWEGRLASFMAEAEGAYSLVILTRDSVYGVRDPLGLRPLCIGRLPENGHPVGYVLASESCALGTIGAEFVREVRPGEIVRLDADGLHSRQAVDPAPEPAFCIFEYVYFARPDSVIEDQTVHRVRQRLGEMLASEAPADADIVVGVPDSATPAAIGYAIASDLPYTEGLIKNRYIGRTFIQPDKELRKVGVQLKYNPLSANLRGKRVVMIDDSIVRGTTAGPLIQLLRDGGASEVHVRVSSPPVRHPCFMGVDMATRKGLIAHTLDVEQIRAHIGADSLAYLSLNGLLKATHGIEGAATEGVPHLANGQSSFCAACFSGRYPIPIPAWLFDDDRDKTVFEL